MTPELFRVWRHMGKGNAKVSRDEQRKQRCGGLLAIDALTRSKAMQVVIERVSFAPLAFNCVFDAELWSTTTDAKMEVKVSINRCGMYLYTSDGILCHFFALEDKLVAWMPLNCMIILYVVHEECLSLFSEEDVNKTKVKVDGDGRIRSDSGIKHRTIVTGDEDGRDGDSDIRA